MTVRSPKFSLVVFLLLAGCGTSNSLNPLDKAILSSTTPSSVSVNFCTDPAYPQKQYLKTIVILDHSGSNQKNFWLAADGSGAPDMSTGTPIISSTYATDPYGLLRYGQTTQSGTLLNYLANLPANDPADPTKYFALIDFSSGATTYPANSAGFTSDINGFFNFVAQDATAGGTAPADGGATSYLSALGAAFNIMNADVQAAAACAAQPSTAAPTAACPQPGKQIASSYVVVFMSDGAPIIALPGIKGVDANGNVVLNNPGQPLPPATYESSTDILAKVSSMMALTSNQKFVTSVNVFTVYYYNQTNRIDQTGRALLGKMAKAGNGLEYDALSGSSIDYSKFQPPQKRIRYTLTDVFVTNQSAIWWTDGTLHKDTDGDGLPDDVELAFGTDPTQVDTNGNGVSDFVEYRLAAGGPATNVNFATGACSGVPKSTVAGKTVFKASDVSGLNDCEKIALNDLNGLGNADSNGDQIPDFLEFAAGLLFQAGNTPAITSRDQDGFTPYQKIKLSLPMVASYDQLLNATPASYNLTLLSSNESQDCYALNVANLPVLSTTDVVRVDVIEKSELLRDNGLFRVGRKAFPNARAVHFDDWMNAGELAAGTWSISQ